MKTCIVCNSENIVIGNLQRDYEFTWNENIPELDEIYPNKILGNFTFHNGIAEVRSRQAIGCKTCGYIAYFSEELQLLDEKIKKSVEIHDEHLQQQRKEDEEYEIRMTKIAELDEQIENLKNKRKNI